VSQIYDQNYKAQLAAYQQQQMQRSGMLQGLGAIGGAILGGPVGSSIGSGIAGMFGSGNQQLPWQVAGQGN
jgi:outer membrane lipoprotein SlyB